MTSFIDFELPLVRSHTIDRSTFFLAPNPGYVSPAFLEISDLTHTTPFHHLLSTVVEDEDRRASHCNAIDMGHWSAGLDLVAHRRHEFLKRGCVVVALGLMQMLGAGFCSCRSFCSVKYPPMAMVRFPSFAHPIPPPPSPPLTTRTSVPPLASTS